MISPAVEPGVLWNKEECDVHAPNKGAFELSERLDFSRSVDRRTLHLLHVQLSNECDDFA
jgi:hypothetical protein